MLSLLEYQKVFEKSNTVAKISGFSRHLGFFLKGYP
jgi:hypothetical protein